MVKRMWVRPGAVAVTLALALLGAACSSDDDADTATKDVADTSEDSTTASGSGSGADDAVFPDAEWATADPADEGFDQAKLDELAAEAAANKSNCVLVTRHGKAVAEWYWNDGAPETAQEVYSATKSYTSTLVGIAQTEGLLDIDDKASEYIPEWVGTPSEDVTIKNLLSNDSGRQWAGWQGDYIGLTTAPDRDAYAIGLGQDTAPGETWIYNNSAIQTLDAVLEKATGMPTADYAEQKLFDPIGMTSSHMNTDSAGHASTYFGLQSTCRDMARYGYLFLQEGNWDGTEIVPADWVAEATTPSQDINTNYGYLWWLNTPGKQINGVMDAVTKAEADAAPPREGPAGAAEEMFWAEGLGGQIIQIDPTTDTVVVRLGAGDVASPYGADQTAKFVTEALTDP
jgi:CubicO group peptidase (beta-lactamase class C family)